MIKFENKNNGRFYYVYVSQDMLNDLVIRIVFGGVGVSRDRIIFCGNRKDIQKEIERITKRRLSRGYSIVT